ncbi:unnamed protein product, partial [Adineta steineri]
IFINCADKDIDEDNGTSGEIEEHSEEFITEWQSNL